MIKLSPKELRNFRKRTGLSERKFAKAVGINRGSLFKMETFRIPINQAVIEKLEAYANANGMSLYPDPAKTKKSIFHLILTFWRSL